MVPSNSPNLLIGLAYGVFSSVSLSSVFVFFSFNQNLEPKSREISIKHFSQTFVKRNIISLLEQNKRFLTIFRDPSGVYRLGIDCACARARVAYSRHFFPPNGRDLVAQFVAINKKQKFKEGREGGHSLYLARRWLQPRDGGKTAAARSSK